MTPELQKLYDLLPAIYRSRDAEQGEPLKALLSVIAQQVAVLREDLEQLYDDQFIETCADWVVPYIGDLIGYRSLHGVVAKISSPRAEVANTIAYRRRKGTAAVLEQLARDVTGWNARVVEFFQLLVTTQHMNHTRLQNWYAPDLRHLQPLERLNTPFDTTSHTVDVRRIATGSGLHNIPNIGIFVWLLEAFPLTDSPAFPLDLRRFFFSPLGNNAPLFTKPNVETVITHLAEPINVPEPISRRVLDEDLEKALPVYYGKDRSLFLRVGNDEKPASEVTVCDLSDAAEAWTAGTQTKIAIDPVLGRVAFPQGQQPANVRVSFHHGFSAAMGGGEYERAASFAVLEPVQQVAPPPGTIQNALSVVAGSSGAVEIMDSGHYAETLVIDVAGGKSVELRAANKHRPTLVLEGDLLVGGGDEAEVTLNGLLIAGAPIRIQATAGNKLRKLRLRHCTLVPGLSLSAEGVPANAGARSLIVEPADVAVEIDQCILGGLQVAEGASIQIRNSIVDATDAGLAAFAASLDGKTAGGRLRIENCTVIGRIHTTLLELVSNTILLADAGEDATLAPIRSVRKQAGCVRFSFLPLESQVPRRHRCRPENAAEANRVRPKFTSLRYGDPGYAQLSSRTVTEIRQGADDEAEMGAFHDIFQPQRETNLRVRLDEYLRFGLEAGIFHAT
jgi:hypothetical protein